MGVRVNTHNNFYWQLSRNHIFTGHLTKKKKLIIPPSTAVTQKLFSTLLSTWISKYLETGLNPFEYVISRDPNKFHAHFSDHFIK